ncbi:MAG: VWA domain-containing protein [Paracoccaceae bacterium]
MSDDLDKLKSAMHAATPDATKNAQKRAMDAGMAAFAENFQGSGDTARPTFEHTQWWVRISNGVNAMFKRLTTRETLLTTASLATIAVAVIVTGKLTVDPYDYTPPAAVETDAPEAFQTSEQSDIYAPQLLATDTPAPNPAPPAFAGVRKVENNVLPNVGAVEETQKELARSQDDMRADSAGISQAEAEMAPMPADISVAAPRVRGALEIAPPVSYVAPAEPLTTRHADGEYDTDELSVLQASNNEQFAGAAVSPIKVTREEPVSTFSIDVDTASYAYVRSKLLAGIMPNPDAVRTEELINYFDYSYPGPVADTAPFNVITYTATTPWNPDTMLLHVGIQGYALPIEDRPPVNLVFLIDTSGSMADANKLPLLIQSFRLLLSELNDHDQVAIVTYAGSAGMVLEPTPASQTRTILDSLMRLSAGGSTAGQAGLQQAYALAEQMGDDGDTSRVILATDGDFNVGISDPEALQKYIENKRDSGVYLSILGFGEGNYNDALMQTLAQNGNGMAAYIDTLAEAQKVLVDQIGGALFTIAKDVKIQVEFNPAEVAEYRLIGYETRALAREDFNNDAVDAGDVGAGHSVTALYEITLVGSPAVSVDPLRYGEAETLAEGNGELAFVKLRYKRPGEDTSQLITIEPISRHTRYDMTHEMAFPFAVAGFGQLLRGDTRLGDWSYDDVAALAKFTKGDDPFGYRAEFIRLVRLAESLQ